jgi:hypothetical protein
LLGISDAAKSLVSSDLGREMRYTELTDTIVTGPREIFAGSEYGLDPGFIADADHIAVSNTDPITGAPAKLDSKR